MKKKQSTFKQNTSRKILEKELYRGSGPLIGIYTGFVQKRALSLDFTDRPKANIYLGQLQQHSCFSENRILTALSPFLHQLTK